MIAPLAKAARRDHPVSMAAAPVRIEALDMTKGVLVVCMVIYHSFNYSRDYSLGFKLLPFLPPSFILITGFLLGRIYLSGSRKTPSPLLRPCLRGFRLVAIFTLLNVVAQIAGRQHPVVQTQGLGYFFDHWFEVYVTGEGRLAAFEVLLPISYLLILAPLLCFMDRLNRYLLPALALSLVVISTISEQQGELYANLHLLTAGIIGMILGRVDIQVFFKLGRLSLAWIAAYGLYLAAAFQIGQIAIMQLIGACLALMVLFSLCIWLGKQGFIQRLLVALGRYSLVGYILQIALLQILVRLLGRLTQYSAAFFTEMFAVLLILVIAVCLLDWVRKASRNIDLLYRAIFA
jgi:peptidoglycan/LPS O-acetylase OafA/YrhL